MKRRFISGSALAAAVVLAACGSSGSSGSGGSGGSSGTSGAGIYGGSGGSTTPAAQAGSVSVKQIDGIGDVLVDSNGMALYSPDEEASGKVLCTGGCTSIWTPLAASGGTPTSTPGVAALAVIDRPDGSKQLAVAGKPLYTFSQDSPGKVTGDGVSDDFDGQHFTWHAVLADGTTSAASAASTGSGTTGTDAGRGDPGYGG